ncbi:MAG TPA: hypothetical protein VGQ13_06570 [Nitrososphaera sp.]|nr:hypothetical protein [Nitrososphaera sp.]
MNNKSSKPRKPGLTLPRLSVRWILIIFAVWFMIWTPLTFFDPMGRYSYKEAKVDEQSYEYPIHLNVTDIADNSKIYRIDMLMYSRSYSAQYPIRVDILLVRQVNGTAEKDVLHIIFPHSDYSLRRADEKPEQLQLFGGAKVSMALPENTTWYNNTGGYGGDSIQYAMQGCYNIVVTSKPAYLRNHDVFKYDCTQLNIASLESTSALKASEAQIGVTNSALKLASDTLRVSDLIYGLTVIGLFIAVITFVQDKANKRL